MTPSGTHRTTIVFVRHSSTRHTLCTCGWVGPQRATIELLADDALVHEQSDHRVVKKPAPPTGEIRRMAGHDYVSAGDTPYADGERAYTGCFLCGGPRSEHPR